MSRPFSPIVVIPARLGSTRLPGKPLSLIHGEPMIVHVWRRAAAADIGPVVVACAQSSIAEAVAGAGGRAVLTRPEHASGSDRVFEAVESLDPEGRHDVVVNLQGDLPTIAPEVVRAVLRPLGQSEAVDIATLAAQIVDPAARGDPNVVKAAVAFPPSTSSGQAQDRPLMLSLSKHEPVDPSTSSGLALP
ncbi:MAG: cytidylyltransferase domain-containing protein, partial [Kiloniellaceae bacterium]